MIYLGPPADELRHAVQPDYAAAKGRIDDIRPDVGAAAHIAGGLADGVEKALGAALDYAADFIAPPPPPTKEQIEQMQKAAEERQQQAAAREVEEQARRDLLDEIKRGSERARGRRATALRPLDGTADQRQRSRRRPRPWTRAQPVAVSRRIEAIQRRQAEPLPASLWRETRQQIASRSTPAPADPKPPRRRSGGETDGEFRWLARIVSRLSTVRQSFRLRAAITSRYITIDADAVTAPAVSALDMLNRLNNDTATGSDLSQSADSTNQNYLSPHL